MVHSLYINLENIFEWFMVNGLKSIVILLLLGEKKKTELCLLWRLNGREACPFLFVVLPFLRYKGQALKGRQSKGGSKQIFPPPQGRVHHNDSLPQIPI